MNRSFQPLTQPDENRATAPGDCATIIDVLSFRAKSTPSQVAFHFGNGDRLTDTVRYGELWSQVRSVAAALVDRDAVGRRIVLLYPPGLEFLVGFFATLASGSIAVPSSLPRAGRRGARLSSILDDSGAEFLLTTSEMASCWEADETVKSQLAGVTVMATDRVPDAFPSPGGPPVEIDRSDIALIQYTSGSTAEPKGVVLTHDNLLLNCGMIVGAFEIDRFGMGATWLPTYHDMGLVGGVLSPLLAGKPNILMSPAALFQDPMRWLRTISENRVNVSGGPDVAYRFCVDKVSDEDVKKLNLGCWKVAFTGAERVRHETLEAFADKFAPAGFRMEAFFPCYGLAEATLIVTGGPRGAPAIERFDAEALSQNVVSPVDAAAPHSRILVASGEVLPGEQVVIVDPGSSSELPDGRIGEIWVDSPSVGPGYWNDGEETRNTFAGELSHRSGRFLRTGDLGFFHRNRLFVTGRIKDLIIVRGSNFYPQDIEATCEAASAAVLPGGAAAFSIERDGRECLAVVAETVRRRDLDWDCEMEKIRLGTVSEHEVSPSEIVLVRPASVPRTSSGKIRRQACRHLFQSGGLKVVACWQAPTASGSPSTASPHPDAIIRTVQAFLGTRGNGVTGESRLLSDLGLDSIEQLALIHTLEKEFGGRLPVEQTGRWETVSDLACAVSRYLGQDKSRSEFPVDDSSYRFDLFPEIIRLQAIHDELSTTGLPNPYFAIHEGVAANRTWIGERELINFASYNYLGLCGHPEVTSAAQSAADRYGTSCSASRLVSGQRPVHEELETGLAEFLGVEAALAFVGGHSTNETVIGHLFGPDDLILYDSYAHNSIIQGAKLSGARRLPFAHNDADVLEAILCDVRRQYRRVLVVIEGVYSMDGDSPDLRRFVEIKKRHRCLLMVDEAHSLGTVGATGRGAAELCGVTPEDVDIYMGTLSKALASCGGFIAGSKALIEYLKYTAPGFVFSVGISPAAAAAAAAALAILRREPHRVGVLQDRSRQFLEGMKRLGLDTGPSSGAPIVPLILGNSRATLEWASHLFQAGINVPPVLYPAVAESSSRLRFFLSSEHSETDIHAALEAISLIPRGTEP